MAKQVLATYDQCLNSLKAASESSFHAVAVAISAGLDDNNAEHKLIKKNVEKTLKAAKTDTEKIMKNAQAARKKLEKNDNVAELSAQVNAMLTQVGQEMNAASAKHMAELEKNLKDASGIDIERIKKDMKSGFQILEAQTQSAVEAVKGLFS